MTVVATATLVITAADDAAIDEVYAALHPLVEGYPGRTISITETTRRLDRPWTPTEPIPQPEPEVEVEPAPEQDDTGHADELPDPTPDE